MAPKGEEAIYECDHNIRLLLSRADAIVSGIAQMGRTNPLETKLLLQYLRPEDTVVEVGTYKDGWLALVSSGIVGPSGRVVCFEPIPSYYRDFKKNIALNDRQNMIVENLAISDVVGTATFALREENSSMVLEYDVPVETVVAETTTLDEWCRSKGIEAVTLAIIDTEGAETKVLNGAKQMLPKTTYLIIEVIDSFCRQAGTTAEKLIDQVCSFGFTPYVITRRGLVRWQPGKESETLNLFFINEASQRSR
jgi:FkbM family methyltransferase